MEREKGYVIVLVAWQYLSDEGGCMKSFMNKLAIASSLLIAMNILNNVWCWYTTSANNGAIDPGVFYKEFGVIYLAIYIVVVIGVYFAMRPKLLSNA